MKAGDMVKAWDAISRTWHTGIVIGMEEVSDLFSEKYAIMETNTYVRVLVEGQVITFTLGEDKIEVINA